MQDDFKIKLNEQLVLLQMRLEKLFEENRKLLNMYGEMMGQKNEVEGTANKLTLYLLEGDLALDEARKEIEVISKDCISQQLDESKGHMPQEQTVNVSHKMLLHAYQLTKNLEDRMAGLWKVVSHQTQKQANSLEDQAKEDGILDGKSSQMELQDGSAKESGLPSQINHLGINIHDDVNTVPATRIRDDSKPLIYEEWDLDFTKEANQTKLKLLKQEKLEREPHNDTEELQLKLMEAEDRIIELSTTVRKLMFSNKQWRWEKINLCETIKRLRSLVAEKERESVVLQNEEATLEAIIKKMHEDEN